MVTGAEPGFGMWPFGQHCTCHALAARNARLEAELGRCLDKMRYLEAMRACEAEERARDRAAMASMRSDLEEAREKIAGQKRLIQYYEHRNNPSSTMSLRHKKLEKFKAGLKAKKSEAAEGGEEEPEKPRRTGPPKGHAGVSHSNKPERIVRIPFKRCAKCSGARVEQRRTFTKLASDFGPDNKVHTMALIVGEGVCLDCGARSKAPTGVLEGTSFGPRLLGVANEYFHVNCTDAAIAQLFERVHGFRTSPNAVLNAREALADSLRRHQIPQIKAEFSKYVYVIADETFFAYRKKKGVIWVMLVPTAVLVSFEITRSAWVLEERFGWLCLKVVVADGYGPYKTFFVFIQRDWIHVLRHALDSLERLTEAAKEAKEKDRPQAEAARDLAACAHADLHALRAAAHETALSPFTVHDLVLEARRLAPMFDPEFETELYNAAPDLFTFVWKKGVPDNTALVEVTIRDALVRQRNVRHQMTNKRGRERFSALVSFNHTCELNGAWPCRAVREICLDPPWNMFSQVPDRGPDWSVFEMWPPPARRRAIPAVA